MPPTLLLIRHAQAEHNVSSDWSIRDAPLTELGKQQCLELQESLKNSEIGNQVEHIVVSAQRRTLQTATIGLDWLIKKGIPVTPSALWQENSDKPCDTGSPLPTISSEFPQYDFSHVDPSFPDKTTTGSSNPYAFTRLAILARGQTALQELYSRPEKVIAVVSHSGFLRTAVANRMFFNADWRVFEFDEEEGERQRGFVLKEWEETEKKGGGMGRSEVGVFGEVEGDFPTEEERVGEVGEASREVPRE
ncbi:phosphoglycerate mutase-like protein [Plenodomus tracheiphilus IPT5]|uniref:Phosphoglycerate mutase-like protein n=1 Tax=Plenodomus tracheiphilus IPT5 TaxID=1408161 RepID=A0A6A7BH45_9PLEO|nr:phosphoglycerate mutase-like protein [Plenodomus tracheiphilus IPT5]